MSIRLEITADSMAEMLSEMEDFAFLLIGAATEQVPVVVGTTPQPATAESGADPQNPNVPPVDAEEVKPPRKPRTGKKPPETIEAVANPIPEPSATPAPQLDALAASVVAPAGVVEDTPKTPDVETVRKKVIAFVSETAKTPDEKRVAFDALRKAVGVEGPVSEWPVDKFSVVLAHILEKSAAA